MWRKIIPFIAALVAAFAITALSQLANWSSGPIYALIGFVGGALVFLGIPFAFDVFLFQRRHQMHAYKPTVIAEQYGHRVTLAEHEPSVATKGLEQDEVGGLRPLIVAAGGAIRVCTPIGEPPFERVEVGHSGQHLTPEPAGRGNHF
jgi:hypothetical protein